jgi:hypothetical protein
LNNKGEWSDAPAGGQFMLDIKHQYVMNLGNVPGSSYEQLDPDRLEKKLEICREYLAMLEVVHPGFNYQKSRENSFLINIIRIQSHDDELQRQRCR